jgi:TonB-dependent SusC/RagA subfamily outer membrane receptor
MKNLLVTALILLSNFAFGQLVVTPKAAQGPDIFKGNLFSADRIMDARNEINLTDAQAVKIKKIHAANAGEFSTLKWDLDEANSKLQGMLEKTKIDQTAVSKQMDLVLEIENKLKKKQLNSLVAIKNELTEDQINYLDKHNVVTVVGYPSPVGSSMGVASVNGTAVVSGRPSYATSITQGVKGTGTVAIHAQNEGDDAPLYVIKKNGIDTFILPSEMKDINPSNIESLNVLKGKSATNIYGQKAKNGAIIITLKEK